MFGRHCTGGPADVLRHARPRHGECTHLSDREIAEPKWRYAVAGSRSGRFHGVDIVTILRAQAGGSEAEASRPVGPSGCDGYYRLLRRGARSRRCRIRTP